MAPQGSSSSESGEEGGDAAGESGAEGDSRGAGEAGGEGAGDKDPHVAVSKVERAPGAQPHILKHTPQRKEVTVQNPDAWAAMAEGDGEKAPGSEAAAEHLWSEFRDREEEQERKEREAGEGEGGDVPMQAS